ncbi:MAG: NrfD/PsrC family molybdoenzyme membrane anchor subunit [Candidatus Binatia bacterium]
MSTTSRPVAVGGPILTPAVLAMFGLAALAGVLILWRAVAGLGATTAMNDGYPWGLWIAFDVVTGTALGCGGYAIALLVYILNQGRYHPLVRPALLTSALGYSIAGFSVLLDLGRPWLTWKIPVFFWQWNGDSVLLEVALCIMAYSMVLWYELSPAFLERAEASESPRLQNLGRRLLPIVRKSLLWVTALGLLLPTMHQSSLGALLLLSGPRLHALWNTPVLPLLFLVSCVFMGFGAVVIEGALSSRFFGRRAETDMLAGLGRVMLPLIGLYLGIRFVDLAVRGQVGALLAFDTPALMWLLEVALFVAAATLLASDGLRRDLGNLFRAALLLLFAGALYRFDVFLLAFDPGAHWSYFPNVNEILITVGLVAGEIGVYIVFVRMFPILAGRPQTTQSAVHPAVARGVS